MEEVQTVKKVALYARVSSDLQKKGKTIESQIFELKRQIVKDGHILAKEYIDNGFSGARLDRPAMEQLRKDLKTNVFETIYFLNTDRIARDVTYQTIIISEILRWKKQLIINGKDYVHNPENKFTVTVLGAVAELERAKIIERNTRGKNLRMSQGIHGGRGTNIYGYDYQKKTPVSIQKLMINEREANTVRFIFEEYAKDEIGMYSLTRKLEEQGHVTKMGHKLWRGSQVKCILKNTAYTGVIYFNRTRVTKEYADPITGVTKTRVNYSKRDKSEWLPVAVPPIVSQELFDKVQEKREYNKVKYRNPKRVQILSNLIECGSCGSSYFSLRRHLRRPKKNNQHNIYDVISYNCNWRFRAKMHSLTNGLKRCKNRQISAHIIEEKVWDVFKTTVFDSKKLKEKIEVIQGKAQNSTLRLRRKVTKLEKEITAIQRKKQLVLNLYTSAELDKQTYSKKSAELDKELEATHKEKVDTQKQIPLLHDSLEIDIAIKRYCETIKLRFKKCDNFDSQRKFCLEFIDKIVHRDDGLTLYGYVPIESEVGKSKLEFKIEKSISNLDRGKRRLLVHGY